LSGSEIIFRTRVSVQNKLLFVGIDAGAHGAIVELYGSKVSQFPLMVQFGSRKKDVRLRTRWEVLEHLRQCLTHCPPEGVEVCIEDPGVSIFRIRKQDLAKLNRSFAELRMACVAVFGDEPLTVGPKEWIGWLDIPSRLRGESSDHWKKRLADVARRKFPRVTVHSDTADALLIASYCRWRCETAAESITEG
jgi:hypothetical protein